MDTPFLVGQPVRVVRVPHHYLSRDIGLVEIVVRVAGCCVWCRPAVRLSDGSVRPDERLRYEVARRVDDLEAVVCA